MKSQKKDRISVTKESITPKPLRYSDKTWQET